MGQSESLVLPSPASSFGKIEAGYWVILFLQKVAMESKKNINRIFY